MINSNPNQTDFNLLSEHPLRMLRLLLIEDVILPNLDSNKITKELILSLLKEPIDSLLGKACEIKEDMCDDTVKLVRMFDMYKEYYTELLMCDDNLHKAVSCINFKGVPHSELLYHLKSLSLDEIFDIVYNVDKTLFTSKLNLAEVINIEEANEIIEANFDLNNLETEVNMWVLADEIEYTLSNDYYPNELFANDCPNKTRTEEMDDQMFHLIMLDVNDTQLFNSTYGDKYDSVKEKYQG